MSLEPSVVGRGYSGNAKSTRATFRLFDRNKRIQLKGKSCFRMLEGLHGAVRK